MTLRRPFLPCWVPCGDVVERWQKGFVSRMMAAMTNLAANLRSFLFSDGLNFGLQEQMALKRHLLLERSGSFGVF